MYESCKNCNEKLTGNFCSKCGQKVFSINSVIEVFKDFLDTVFSLDSKFFQTFRFLITKPGFLTKEYWKGKRVRYLPPFRTYFAISLLYFLLLPLKQNQIYFVHVPSFEQVNQLNDSPEDLCVEAKKEKLKAHGIDLSEGIQYISFGGDSLNEFDGASKYEIGGILNRGFRIADDKQMTLEGVLSSFIPATIFIMMPFMAAVLFLLFHIKRELFYIHHLIAVIHLHAFIFFIFILHEIISHLHHTFFLDHFSNILDILSGTLILWIFLYTFMMLKNLYEDSRFKSFIKMTLLFVIYSVALVIALPIIFLVSLYFI